MSCSTAGYISWFCHSFDAFYKECVFKVTEVPASSDYLFTVIYLVIKKVTGFFFFNKKKKKALSHLCPNLIMLWGFHTSYEYCSSREKDKNRDLRIESHMLYPRHTQLCLSLSDPIFGFIGIQQSQMFKETQLYTLCWSDAFHSSEYLERTPFQYIQWSHLFCCISWGYTSVQCGYELLVLRGFWRSLAFFFMFCSLLIFTPSGIPSDFLRC